MILFTHYIYPWKLANLLVGLHFCEIIWCNGEVMPAYVPSGTQLSSTLLCSSIRIFYHLYYLKFVALPCCLLNYLILGTVDVDDNPILIFTTAQELFHVIVLTRVFWCPLALNGPLISILIIEAIIVLFSVIVIIIIFFLLWGIGILVVIFLGFWKFICPWVILVVWNFAIIKVLIRCCRRSFSLFFVDYVDLLLWSCCGSNQCLALGSPG